MFRKFSFFGQVWEFVLGVRLGEWNKQAKSAFNIGYEGFRGFRGNFFGKNISIFFGYNSFHFTLGF